MPERAIAAANDLTKELHAKGRRDTIRNLVETALLLLVAALVAGVLFNVVVSRHENASRSQARDAQYEKLLQLSAQIRDATDPSGCVAQRNQRNQTAAIATIVNEEKKDHSRPTIPVPAQDTTPCPGEVGGPPLVIPDDTTTSTTRLNRHAPGHTATTRKVQTASSAPGSSSPPMTTSTAARKPCTVPVDPCPV